MRVKNKLKDDLDYDFLFREPINRLHRRWDGKPGIGAGTVEYYCQYAISVLRDPFAHVSPLAGRCSHSVFCGRYYAHPDLFLDVMQTMRAAWFNASDLFRAQIFITLHGFITTHDGKFVAIENAMDGDISHQMDSYWEKKISLATVKKARQLLSHRAASKGKQHRDNSH
jgi:hypothetical protein